MDQIRIEDCWNHAGVWGNQAEKCPRLKDVIHCRNCEIYSRAGRRLLDRPSPAEYMEEWTRILASGIEDKGDNICSAFVFRIGEEWLALGVDLIREVAEMDVIHSLPHHDNYFVKGVVNIRGKLETCISLGDVLGIKKGKQKDKRAGFMSPERLVVIERDGICLVFPVSEIMGIIRYQPHALEDVPVTVAKSKAAYTRNMINMDGKEIGLLDEERLFDFIIRSAL